MTGPRENSEFCFPETLNVPRGEAEGSIEVEGKQNSLFPAGPVIKCFVIPPDSKIETKLRRNRLLGAGWPTNLVQFQGARPDHVRVESSSCCFPRELVSFVRPRELVSFDPRHVTRSRPIGKRIWIGRYNKSHYAMLYKYGKRTVNFGGRFYLYFILVFYILGAFLSMTWL